MLSTATYLGVYLKSYSEHIEEELTIITTEVIFMTETSASGDCQHLHEAICKRFLAAGDRGKKKVFLKIR